MPEKPPPLPTFALVVAGCLLLQLLRPVWDVDIFWQLKLGELTLRGGLPANEPFLAGKEGEPLAVVAWLGQAAYALVRSEFGWAPLRVVDAFIWLFGMVYVAVQCVARQRNQFPATVGLLVAWVAAVPFASVRPQSFALLALGLLVVLVRSERRTLFKVALGTTLLVLWQNLHPSAAVAVGYLAARGAGEWLPLLLKRAPRPGIATLVLIPIAAAATLATPAGAGIYAVSAANRDICVWEGLQITEWFPVWDFFPDGGRLQAVVCLSATLLVAAASRKKQSLADVLPMLALTGVTLLTHRFVIFWAVAAIPVWAAALDRGPTLPPLRQMLGLVLCTQAFILPTIALRDHLSPSHPVEHVRRLAAANVAGAVYCPYTYGGVVTDGGYPAMKPTHDGRYYLFSKDQLTAHHAARRGEVSLSELDREFHPVAFLIPANEGLIAVLDTDAGWVRLYADEHAVAFVRKSR